MSTAVDSLAAPIDAGVNVIADDMLARDVALAEVVFNGKKLRGDLANAVIDASVRRTVEGASTLTMTLADPRLEILNSGLLTSQCDIEVDGLAFRLVAFGFGSGRTLALTFEDREVAILRGFKKPRRAYRDKITRARFARSLVREAKTIAFYSPELDVRQPVAGQRTTTREKQATKAPGFSPNETIRVKGSKATREQRRVLERVLDVGRKLGAPRKVMIAAVATAVVESNARNLRGGDRDSAGVFQQRPSQGWGTYAQVRDIEYAARSFFTRAIREYRREPGQSAGAIAQAVQRSAYPSRYNAWAAEARDTVDAYTGGTTTSSAREERTRVARYAFTRGAPGGPKGEDTWSCLQRLATEVGWRCFMVAAVVYFISERKLFAAKPIATLTPDADGFDDPEFDYDTGKPVAECRIAYQAGRWQAPPGSVVKIEGYGPGDGRWLVAETERSLFSKKGTATMRKPQPTLPEPAPETIQTSGSSSSSSSISSSTASAIPRKLQQAYARAQAIDAKRYPYVFGGGHGASFAPTGGGYDCSGAVSAVLGAAGELSRPQTTVGLASFGVSGEGKYLTVWVRNTSNPRESHVFLEFKYPGKGRQHWGTGRWGESLSGPGFKPTMHPKSGFSPRHIRGL